MTHEQKKEIVERLKENWKPLIGLDSNNVEMLYAAKIDGKLLEWIQASADFQKVPKGTGSTLDSGTVYRIHPDYVFAEDRVKKGEWKRFEIVKIDYKYGIRIYNEWVPLSGLVDLEGFGGVAFSDAKNEFINQLCKRNGNDLVNPVAVQFWVEG